MPLNTDDPATSLPEPGVDEAEHSLRLIELMQSEMSTGPIDFSRFMELALYAPGLGYYSAGKTKFGESGDFVTAPELGNVFARCLARQCAQVLDELNGGDILEAGAGNGALAADILLELENLQQLPRHYYILELSADLRQRQHHRIAGIAPHLLERVRWLDDFPETGFEGIILANELLDAMPVSVFHVMDDGIMQRHVTMEDNRFAWTDLPASPQIRQRVKALGLEGDYCSEINLNAEAWIRSAATTLTRGIMLLIDYGFPQHEYYHPQRNMGTLMCHYRHHAHTDPLAYVGLQDITAHVDFTAMAQAAVDSGLDVLGYTSQAAFLMASGLDEIMAGSHPDDARQHLDLTIQVKKLTLPSEMGELFKVLALGKDFDASLIGFSLQDRRDRL
jgi:SAM-dependent MidA family methyltransferase